MGFFFLVFLSRFFWKFLWIRSQFLVLQEFLGLLIINYYFLLINRDLFRLFQGKIPRKTGKKRSRNHGKAPGSSSLFPAGFLGSFSHSQGRILGMFWGFFGVFRSRALPGICSPVFLRISLKNPGSNPSFPSPKSHFLQLGSEIPTKSPPPTKLQLRSEQILGWGKKLE